MLVVLLGNVSVVEYTKWVKKIWLPNLGSVFRVCVVFLLVVVPGMLSFPFKTSRALVVYSDSLQLATWSLNLLVSFLAILSRARRGLLEINIYTLAHFAVFFSGQNPEYVFVNTLLYASMSRVAVSAAAIVNCQSIVCILYDMRQALG